MRGFAQEEGVAMIDLAERSEFTEETEAVMQPNDGLHFGEEGYKTLAAIIADELKEYI